MPIFYKLQNGPIINVIQITRVTKWHVHLSDGSSHILGDYELPRIQEAINKAFIARRDAWQG